MARKRTGTEDQLECKTLRANSIQLLDEQGRLRALIDVSPATGKPNISLFDGDFEGENVQHISLGISASGQASIGIGGKNVLVVGMNASQRGQRAVFVLDDNGREVFVAGVDMNGDRFVRLLATDGSTIWEMREEKK